jgi:hypothetical protein
MIDARARRAVVIFLLILTLVVLLRAVSTAHGATTGARAVERPERRSPGRFPAVTDRNLPVSIQIEETGDLLAGGTTAHRTLLLRGLQPRSGELELDWEARVPAGLAASGRESVSTRSGGSSRIILSIPLPAVQDPVGLELRVRASDAGRLAGEAAFAFTLYPPEGARRMAEILGRSRVALYDPEGKAAATLRSLGLLTVAVNSYEDLTLGRADLIVVGPGGFSRGSEALGPILAARVKSGTPVLILDQPTLPGTLSEDLRLWPSFNRSPETSVVFSPDHPILSGLRGDSGAAYFAATPARIRPLLPPTRGNFRVVAEVRVRTGPSWQEGVELLEFRIGEGTVLVAQASLCADYEADPRARILLANSLAYLLAGRQRLKRTFVYGGSTEDLAACVARLAPRAPRAPADLEGVEVLLVSGDWQAPRLKEARGLPPLARVARFLHEGGTVLLLNPQTLVLDYLRGVSGSNVYFETGAGPGAGTDGVVSLAGDAGSLTLMQGISADDLVLLKRPGRPEFRLRALPGSSEVRTTLVAPGLARYLVGRGTLVALTLPDASDCSLPRTSSLISRILTNLGVPLDPGPGIDPEAITLLDK